MNRYKAIAFIISFFLLINPSMLINLKGLEIIHIDVVGQS